MNYQKLFDYLQNEFGITALESEMQEIVNISTSINDKPYLGLATTINLIEEIHARIHTLGDVGNYRTIDF